MTRVTLQPRFTLHSDLDLTSDASFRTKLNLLSYPVVSLVCFPTICRSATHHTSYMYSATTTTQVYYDHTLYTPIFGYQAASCCCGHWIGWYKGVSNLKRFRSASRTNRTALLSKIKSHCQRGCQRTCWRPVWRMVPYRYM